VYKTRGLIFLSAMKSYAVALCTSYIICTNFEQSCCLCIKIYKLKNVALFCSWTLST